jgi:hypothetical protein
MGKGINEIRAWDPSTSPISVMRSPTGVMWHKNRWILFLRMHAFRVEKNLQVIMYPMHTLQIFWRGFYIYLLHKACISQQEYGAELNVRAFPFATLQMCSPPQKLPCCLTSPWLHRLTNLRLGSSSRGFAQIKFVTLL